jgi:DNA-binding CsgD family transcriptional regulator
MYLREVEKLIRYLMKPGISRAELCKFLVLETFAHTKISAIYTAEITDDGCIAPLGTFGIPAQVVANWGNISLATAAPFTDAVKQDKVILMKREGSLEKYPMLAQYEAAPENWESYLVCPILPHGLIALTLDSTPKLNVQFETFLRAVGAIVMNYYTSCDCGGVTVSRKNPKAKKKKSASLTDRQNIILNLIQKGLTNPAIAEQIGYSESLVRQETMAIYAKLSVSGRKDLLEGSSD